MTEKKLNMLEKSVNAELSSKISGSEINFGELLFKIPISEIIEVIKFLKLFRKNIINPSLNIYLFIIFSHYFLVYSDFLFIGII